MQRASDAGESVLAREGTKDTRFGRQKRIGRLADTDGFMLRQQGRNLLAPGLPRQRLTIASENQVMPTASVGRQAPDSNRVPVSASA